MKIVHTVYDKVWLNSCSYNTVINLNRKPIYYLMFTWLVFDPSTAWLLTGSSLSSAIEDCRALIRSIRVPVMAMSDVWESCLPSCFRLTTCLLLVSAAHPSCHACINKCTNRSRAISHQRTANVREMCIHTRIHCVSGRCDMTYSWQVVFTTRYIFHCIKTCSDSTPKFFLK